MFCFCFSFIALLWPHGLRQVFLKLFAEECFHSRAIGGRLVITHYEQTSKICKSNSNNKKKKHNNDDNNNNSNININSNSNSTNDNNKV